MNTKTTTLTIAAATLTAGLALSPIMANADVSPFKTAELSSGYMQVAEGNCGGDMAKDHEAKCGADMEGGAEKTEEGKCGEAKCGADKEGAEKAEEGKCGEAKCGADK